MYVSSQITIALRVRTVVEPTTHQSDVETNQNNNEFDTIEMSVGILQNNVSNLQYVIIVKKRDILRVNVTNTKWTRCNMIMETIPLTS